MVRFCSQKCFGQDLPCSNCSSVQFQNTVLMYRPHVFFISTYDCHQKYSYSLSFDKFNQRCIYMSDFMVGFCSPMHFGQDWPCSNCSSVQFQNTWIFSILTISIFKKPRNVKSCYWKSDVYSLYFDKFNQRWIYTSNFMVQFCSPMHFGQDWPCSNCSLVQFQNTVYRPPVLFMSTYDCHQKYSYSLSFDKFNPRCI